MIREKGRFIYALLKHKMKGRKQREERNFEKHSYHNTQIDRIWVNNFCTDMLHYFF